MASGSGSSSARRSGSSQKGTNRGSKGRSDGKGRSDSKARSGGRPTNSKSGGGKGRDARNRRDDKPKKPARAERSGWGSVAQHGAAGATIGQRISEQEAAEGRFTPEETRKFEQRQARRDKEAARHEGLREQAREAIDRGGLPAPKLPAGAKVTIERTPLPGRPPKPLDIKKQMTKIAGEEKASRSWRLFKRAAKEFQSDHFSDARTTMKPLVGSFKNIAELHELYGLSLYRLGEWEEAIESLETFRRLSGTAEQNPVLMDCHRALEQWADVDELWAELGELSPSGELVAEGRIVMAGAQADQGFIDSGVRTLEKGWIPKSRKLFAWIASKEPNFGDAAERSGSV